MYLPLFIAKRLAKPSSKSFSGFIMRLSIAATAVSVAVMLISTALYDGFEHSITQKFYDCWGHIHVNSYLPNESSFTAADSIYLDKALVDKIKRVPNVTEVQPYYIKNAVVKSKGNMEGLLCKGVTENYDWKRFDQYIIQGKKIEFNDSTFSADILLSKYLADRLQVKVNDKLIAYFMQNSNELPRARKLSIKGIYATGLQENDKAFLICDIKMLHQLESDTSTRIFGYEILTTQPKQQEQIAATIHETCLNPPLQSYSIHERFSRVFQWLRLVRDNVNIIYIIMIVVALINMITSMLIFIMDRTQMVGLMKSIGANGTQLRSIFFWQAIIISVIGITIGVILAFALCLIHNTYPLFHLDAEIYYVKTVPLILQPTKVLAITGGTLLLSMLLLIIPTWVIRNINPIKALRFD